MEIDSQEGGTAALSIASATSRIATAETTTHHPEPAIITKPVEHLRHTVSAASVETETAAAMSTAMVWNEPTSSRQSPLELEEKTEYNVLGNSTNNNNASGTLVTLLNEDQVSSAKEQESTMPENLVIESKSLILATVTPAHRDESQTELPCQQEKETADASQGVTPSSSVSANCTTGTALEQQVGLSSEDEKSQRVVSSTTITSSALPVELGQDSGTPSDFLSTDAAGQDENEETADGSRTTTALPMDLRDDSSGSITLDSQQQCIPTESPVESVQETKEEVANGSSSNTVLPMEVCNDADTLVASQQMMLSTASESSLITETKSQPKVEAAVENGSYNFLTVDWSDDFERVRMAPPLETTLASQPPPSSPTTELQTTTTTTATAAGQPQQAITAADAGSAMRISNTVDDMLVEEEVDDAPTTDIDDSTVLKNSHNSASTTISSTPATLNEQEAVILKPAPEVNGRTGTNNCPQIEIPFTIPNKPRTSLPAAPEVIELLDDDEDEIVSEENSKRQKLENGSSANVATISNIHTAAAHSSSSPGRRRLPQWLHRDGASTKIVPGSSLGGRVDSVTLASQLEQAYNRGNSSSLSSTGPLSLPPPLPLQQQPPVAYAAGPYNHDFTINQPEYVAFPPGFQPSWNNLLPIPPRVPPPPQSRSPQQKYFQLSLLNVNEFTITGLPVKFDAPPTPITGLRVPIRQISRDHGKAVYEQDKEGGGGKWRIPLGAYHAFVAYLLSDRFCRVDGIPQHQLQIASLERARQEKGYPTAEQLIELGVPRGLAKALAPFQRGGVDFVLEKGGRALIADEMGLGKTIQGIASMSVYQDEWPLLVLCPSSARYHWENEFQNWLGCNSAINKPEKNGDEDVAPEGHEDRLLRDSQIHVLTSSKGDVLPSKKTRVVICSYGLAPALVDSGKIYPGLFRCILGDETHMLKNKKTKRTSALVPVLSATSRCILLSGTPALARPVELWPQLEILGSGNHFGWWANEAEFMDKYVRRVGARVRAELHALLTGTVMVRRMKVDMLKGLPRKIRSKACLHVLTREQCTEFKHLLEELRQSKGALGKIARMQYSRAGAAIDENPQEASPRIETTESAIAAASASASQNAMLGGEFTQPGASQLQDGIDAGNKRTTLLSRLYKLTGDVKTPLIVDMVRRWLDDPTKGKLCIFAHHISVLNAIQAGAELSNAKDSSRKFIRIDGSTLPKQRQQEIKTFQTDPSVRIAVLGITAAGVAVTLTAASTVWFAELFWTPAIMIQAEDRCHRIGQQARVRCLYFLARGTIDEVLWQLLEKKFRNLGEFVEGKERQKMIVDETFETERELHSMFESLDENGDEKDADVDDDTGIDQELRLDSGFLHDIERLGEEETNMLRILDSDEEEEEGASGSESNRKSPAVEVCTVGTTVEEAITLSDDDDDNDAQDPNSKPSSKPEASSQAAPAAAAPISQQVQPMPNCRIYKINFGGPKLGVTIGWFRNRVVVAEILKERSDLLGENCKPAIGDVLAAVNGVPVPLGIPMNKVVEFVQKHLERPPLELTFAEDPFVLSEFAARLVEQQRKIDERNKAAADDVIELLDDD